MAAPPRLPPKKEVAIALLEQSTLFIHLDPRAEPVRVPPWFKKQPQLVLQVGLNMVVPIPDLEVTDEGISCTLSFNRQPHFCWIPWEAVFALVGDHGRGMVWPEDVPKEVAAQAAQQQPKKDTAAPKLRAVSAESTPEPEAAPEAAKPTKKKRARKPKKAAAVEAGAPEAVKVTKTATRTPPRELAARVRPEPAAASAGQESDAGAAGTSASKRRRELPPYLRVIK